MSRTYLVNRPPINPPSINPPRPPGIVQNRVAIDFPNEETFQRFLSDDFYIQKFSTQSWCQEDKGRITAYCRARNIKYKIGFDDFEDRVFSDVKLFLENIFFN